MTNKKILSAFLFQNELIFDHYTLVYKNVALMLVGSLIMTTQKAKNR